MTNKLDARSAQVINQMVNVAMQVINSRKWSQIAPVPVSGTITLNKFISLKDDRGRYISDFFYDFGYNYICNIDGDGYHYEFFKNSIFHILYGVLLSLDINTSRVRLCFNENQPVSFDGLPDYRAAA